jgi:hypothetical protein
MKNDETPNALDRDDFEGEDAEYVSIGDGIEPLGRGDDLDVEPDDALLEAELGEHDIQFGDVEIDGEIDDTSGEDEDDEDDLEMALLHELGIDLDAADEPSMSLDEFVTGEEPSLDDEVAA